MKSILALAIAFALGITGLASAGMQGQGGSPDAKKPEYKEQNPSDVSGTEKAARTGGKQTGAAAKEKAAASDEKGEFGAAETKKDKKGSQ